MKKAIIISLTLALSALAFAGCNSSDNISSSDVEISTEISTETSKETSGGLVLITEADIPETEASLKEYEKYFITNMPYSFWNKNFSPDDMSSLLTGWGMELDFAYLYNYLNNSNYFDDHLDEQNDEYIYNTEIFEETMMSFFNLTPEQLQSNEAIYNKEDNVYKPNEGVGSAVEYKLVIEKVEENPADKTVKIYYTFYCTSFVIDNDLNTWAQFGGYVLTQKEDDGGFKYIENKSFRINISGRLVSSSAKKYKHKYVKKQTIC